MALARALYRNDKLTSDHLWEANRRHVVSSAVELRVWEVYGGRSECLSAPAREVARTRLLLEARALAEQDLADRQQDELNQARGGMRGARGESPYGAAHPTHVAKVTTATSERPEPRDIRADLRLSPSAATASASAPARGKPYGGWDDTGDDAEDWDA